MAAGAEDNAGNVSEAAEINLVNQTDHCPAVPGSQERQGCQIADKNIVELHSVFLGEGEGSNTQPIPGVVVRVFDRNNADFRAVAGSKNPNGSLYGVIFEANQGKVGQCTTNADGVCFAGEEATGDLLVIIKFVDDSFEPSKIVYVGRSKGLSDFVDTNDDGVVDLATKEFQVIKVYQDGEFVEYRGGSKIVVIDTMQNVIVPEITATNSSKFILAETNGKFKVDTCSSVTTSTSESGTLVTNSNCS